MPTMIAVPLASNASADDHPFIAPDAVPTYSIKASDGLTSTFELIERDGKMMLVLFEDETLPFIAPDDD